MTCYLEGARIFWDSIKFTPVDIVPCNFEKGSEGKIIRSLTDDAVTKEAQISLDLMEPEANEWTVRGILDQIAHSTSPSVPCSYRYRRFNHWL